MCSKLVPMTQYEIRMLYIEVLRLTKEDCEHLYANFAKFSGRCNWSHKRSSKCPIGGSYLSGRALWCTAPTFLLGVGRAPRDVGLSSFCLKGI